MKNQPTQKERIALIREATELNVSYREVLKRWTAEKNKVVKKVKVSKEPEVVEPRQEAHSGVYVPQKDDGPTYEEEPVPPFVRIRIFQHFKRHGITQDEATIKSMHNNAMLDPEQFTLQYGEELAKLIIQL